MPHKRAKAVGKLLFFDNKTTPRSIDRFGFNIAWVFFIFKTKLLKNNTNIIFKEQRIPKQTLLEIKNDYSKQLE